MVGLCFRGTYQVEFLELELSEGTRSNGFESCEQNTSNENCDSSYPDARKASPSPNLNCGDVPYKNIKVQGDDPHGFDRDSDGIGCES